MCVCHSALQPPLSSSEPVSLPGGESQVQSQISWRNKQPQSYWILLWSGVINRQEKRSEITFKTFGIKKWIDPLIKQTAAIHSGDSIADSLCTALIRWLEGKCTFCYERTEQRG